MDNLDFLCRICAKSKCQPILNIFKQKDFKLLRLIEQLTGVALRNKEYMPQQICQACIKDLQQAKEFRIRFIKAQYYFMMVESKRTTQQLTQNEHKTVKHKTNAATTLAKSADNPIRTNKRRANAMTSIECNLEDKMPDSMPLKIEENDIAYEGNSTKFHEIKCEAISIENNPQVTDAQQTITKRNKINKREFICDQCGSIFDNSNHFLTHLNRHKGIKPYQCDLCQKTFFTKTELKMHKLVHNGKRQYLCRYCNRSFLMFHLRTIHERTHTNTRPFVCEQCGKAFTMSGMLKEHLLSHTGERKYDCSVCSKSFLLKKHLRTHYRSQFHNLNLEKQKLVNETSDGVVV